MVERKSTFVYAGYQGECEGTLPGEENAFQLWKVTWQYTISRTQTTMHLKLLNFIVYKLYFNNLEKKSREKLYRVAEGLIVKLMQSSA